MSMKRCFELSISSSVSMIGRAVLVGSVLSFAAACGRRDAAKADSTTADSATASTTASTTNSSSPVESVSTGETTVSTESKSNPAVAASNVTTTPAAPAHHPAHHTDSAKATPAATASAAPVATPVRTVSDTGEKTPADTSKKAAGASDATDHLLVSPQEYEGWKMFSVYCYRCHGVDAMGGGIAPNLRHSVSSEGSVTHDVFITTVTNGRLDKGMPTWKALLSPEQMEDLWLYVNARSSNRLYPGRPHMAKGANP